MSVKIDKNVNIGDGNAIGKNAQVHTSGDKLVTQNRRTTKKKKMWFVRHPWLSAIACSLIASVIFWYFTKN